MSTPAQSIKSSQNEDKAKDIPQLGGLEEDDEFEEFAADDWAEGDDDKTNAHFWEDNWDDDDVEDDFSKQLRAELDKASKQPQPMKM